MKSSYIIWSLDSIHSVEDLGGCYLAGGQLFNELRASELSEYFDVPSCYRLDEPIEVKTTFLPSVSGLYALPKDKRLLFCEIEVDENAMSIAQKIKVNYNGTILDLNSFLEYWNPDDTRFRIISTNKVF